VASESGELSWKIGGEQGEGIDSCGDVLLTVVSRMGYHAYGYKWFSSRIKGGHTNYKVRLADHAVRSATDDLHLLVALDQETIRIEARELVPGGLIVADSQFGPTLPEGRDDIRLVAVPFTQIAKDAGGILYRNMAALGATAALLNLPLDAFEDYVAKKFGRKGDAVVAQNREALRNAHAAAVEALGGPSPLHLPPADGKGRLLLTGNDALALGAVAAGCRIFAGYPITPASSVMEALVNFFPKVGGVVVQAEDEIASITMVAGAAYGGARAMTATSGPGISLMQEGLGLAATAELPVVVVDCQRSGPSTGMPTKNEQSDILALVYGGHGEAPRIVICPATHEQAFADGAEAFNLADRFQCPVIIASDLALAEWKATVDEEDLDLDAIHVDRGALVRQAELDAMERGSFYRYDLTPSGVSARSLPGMAGGQYLATGVEHTRTGKVSEDPQNRVSMMMKRLRKMDSVDFPSHTLEGDPAGSLALVAFGSTYGAVREATERLNAEGVRTRHIHVRRVAPFPAAELKAALEGARRIVVIEHNATGQLRSLLVQHGASDVPPESLLKFDGTLLVPDEVVRAAAGGAAAATVKEGAIG
jgi:2-oxoglutarate/2-oxoacid ferredoxin oxidoreductase subunit alpha